MWHYGWMRLKKWSNAVGTAIHVQGSTLNAWNNNNIATEKIILSRMAMATIIWWFSRHTHEYSIQYSARAHQSCKAWNCWDCCLQKAHNGKTILSRREYRNKNCTRPLQTTCNMIMPFLSDIFHSSLFCTHPPAKWFPLRWCEKRHQLKSKKKMKHPHQRDGESEK